MRKAALTLVTFVVMIGCADAAQHFRMIGYGIVWEDTSHLTFEIGDTLVIDNNCEVKVVVHFLDSDQQEIMNVLAHDYAYTSVVVPVETRNVCILYTMSCFTAGMHNLPSLPEYALLALVVLIALSGLWLRRRASAR